MPRIAKPLSAAADSALSNAVRREYAELMTSSARKIVESPVIQKRAKALRRLNDPRAVRLDAIRQSLPPRAAHAPSKYPHFIATAVQLMAAGESVVLMARFGLRLLPNLPDAQPEVLEQLLIGIIKKAFGRS